MRRREFQHALELCELAQDARAARAWHPRLRRLLCHPSVQGTHFGTTAVAKRCAWWEKAFTDHVVKTLIPLILLVKTRISFPKSGHYIRGFRRQTAKPQLFPKKANACLVKRLAALAVLAAFDYGEAIRALSNLPNTATPPPTSHRAPRSRCRERRRSAGFVRFWGRSRRRRCRWGPAWG